MKLEKTGSMGANMFKKIKKFHEKTMEAYQKDIKDNLEPWKKKVMDIHENAQFLFYMDELEFCRKKGQCLLRGEVVKGTRKIGDSLLCMDGEGKEMARGILLSEPEEKEEHRRGMFRSKRNEFLFEFTSIEGKEVSAMEKRTCDRYLSTLMYELSLMTEDGIKVSNPEA